MRKTVPSRTERRVLISPCRKRTQRRFSEIPALRVRVRSACQKRNFYVRQRCADKHSRSCVSFSTVSTRFCQFEASSSVRANRVCYQACTFSRQRLQQQMNFRIMFQRLKCPLDGGGDGFLVRKYASLAESDIKRRICPLSFFVQYLRLHFAHQPNLQFLQFFRPNGTQRRVFLEKVRAISGKNNLGGQSFGKITLYVRTGSSRGVSPSASAPSPCPAYVAVSPITAHILSPA